MKQFEYRYLRFDGEIRHFPDYLNDSSTFLGWELVGFYFMPNAPNSFIEAILKRELVKQT